jgi:hypothetical protein
VLRALLEIISAIFRIIPGWREKRTQDFENEWRRNRDAINSDLGRNAWWVRDNSSSNSNERDS